MEIEKEEQIVEWLKHGEIEPRKLSAKHRTKVIELGGKYQISRKGTGAGETDIELIAFSKMEGYTVVTEEKNQVPAPGKLSNYRIPLICKKEQVKCINSLSFLQSNKVVV